MQDSHLGFIAREICRLIAITDSADLCRTGPSIRLRRWPGSSFLEGTSFLSPGDSAPTTDDITREIVSELLGLELELNEEVFGHDYRTSEEAGDRPTTAFAPGFMSRVARRFA